MDTIEEIIAISEESVVQGTIPCHSAAPTIGADAGSSIYIALSNTNRDHSVSYAIYNNLTGKKVESGSLSQGNSKSVIIPASDEPQIIRIQNQSTCQLNKITPKLTYSAVVQNV
ncbi:hypothetical protein [Vibrio fluvialis]|uniref:hypothetical protein n=1 Tax=Vibrio fluvialis TaxID=676 RepID=UPI003D7CE698